THDQEEALSLSDRVVVMNHGVIEQVGQPFEIYNFPKTAFTASFVGTLNMHDATVLDAAAGEVRLAGASIAVPSAALGGHRAGDTVKVALRPELLYVHPTGAAVENTLTGVVENVAFLGAVARIHLAVGDTTILVDEFNNPQLSVPAIGSTLTTYFTPESCMVLG
ncbi:MAG: TOBE domain-containing protein, partial [Caldilineaceae bacterium]|nr:TOBE domain-containing protein [Caldilineaceae bacterium]